MRVERRLQARASVAASAVVIIQGRPAGTFELRNLSASGALMIGAPPLAIGERLDLLLTLPAGRDLRLGALVVREGFSSDGAVFAVAFTSVHADDEDAIQTAVLQGLEEIRSAPVLVVDDSPEVCRALRRDLGRLGHSAFAVTTPLEALRFLEDTNHIRTVFVDLVLRGTDGLDVLAFLAAERPGVRRVLMSAWLRGPQLELTRVSSLAPAHATLSKPWTDETLRRALGGD